VATRNNFLGIDAVHANYDRAKVAILPVPYEATTSYGHGTRQGPQAIIKASRMVEYYDEELDRETVPDFGIATLKPVVFNRKTGSAAMKIIQQRVAEILRDGKFPVCLGGEHTISSPIVKAIQDHGGDDFSILQIDAHSDLRETYEGSPWSHACVMKRIYDFNRNIVQVGIRAQCTEERDFIKANHIATFYAKDLHGDPTWKDRALGCLKKRVYVTIDCDGLDPTVIPATGTPEPGGLTWFDTLHFLRRVFQSRTVLGFDVVELAPIKGMHYVDYALAKLVYRLLGYNYCLK